MFFSQETVYKAVCISDYFDFSWYIISLLVTGWLIWSLKIILIISQVNLLFYSGFTPAWPLLSLGLGSLAIVGVVTFFMILINVLLPKRQNRKLISFHFIVSKYFIFRCTNDWCITNTKLHVKITTDRHNSYFLFLYVVQIVGK
jgi:hypothetical protein